MSTKFNVKQIQDLWNRGRVGGYLDTGDTESLSVYIGPPFNGYVVLGRHFDNDAKQWVLSQIKAEAILKFSGLPSWEETTCNHEYVNIGFSSIKMACRYCGKDKE